MGTERNFGGGALSKREAIRPAKFLSVPIFSVSAFAAILLVFLLSGCHRKMPADLFSFRLPASDGPLVEFFSLRGNKATVFVFLAPDCPLSQNYTLTLNNLHDHFGADDFGFYGVVAGDLFSDEEVARFVRQYKIDFPVLRDHDFALADFFGARVTPEVFVVAPNAQIAYKGAVDNWAGDLGQHRTAATENYLNDALSDIQKEQEVRVKETPSVGCFIERKTLSGSQG